MSICQIEYDSINDAGCDKRVCCVSLDGSFCEVEIMGTMRRYSNECRKKTQRLIGKVHYWPVKTLFFEFDHEGWLPKNSTRRRGKAANRKRLFFYAHESDMLDFAHFKTVPADFSNDLASRLHYTFVPEIMKNRNRMIDKIIY